MKKFIVWFLILISLTALLLRFSGTLAEVFLGIQQTGGLSVLSDPLEATVFLNGQEVGKTPYEDKKLPIADYTLKIEKDKVSWQGKIKILSGTETVVNRDLAQSPALSAGEILTLERGKGMTIISNPAEAEVEIDGRAFGKTPLTVNIEPGEHTILVTRLNYSNRSMSASLPDNFNLTISVDLALSEADLSSIQTPAITQTPQVQIKDTPTGFLRVRDKPSLAGKEIARVKPGDTLILLEELTGWFRVRISDGTEGYISSSYAEKKKP